MDNFETQEIANFSAALTRAFELLEIYRNNSGGANCNQVGYCFIYIIPSRGKQSYIMEPICCHSCYEALDYGNHISIVRIYYELGNENKKKSKLSLSILAYFCS